MLSQSNHWVFLHNTKHKSVLWVRASSCLRRKFSRKVKWEDNRTLIRLLNLSYMCWVAQRWKVSRRRPQCSRLPYLKGCGHGDLSSYWTDRSGKQSNSKIWDRIIIVWQWWTDYMQRSDDGPWLRQMARSHKIRDSSIREKPSFWTRKTL